MKLFSQKSHKKLPKWKEESQWKAIQLLMEMINLMDYEPTVPRASHGMVYELLRYIHNSEAAAIGIAILSFSFYVLDMI